MGAARVLGGEQPSSRMAAQAAQAMKTLARGPGQARGKTVRMRVGAGVAHEADVPREAFDLFREILSQMASGNAVSVVPVQAELTTQQAAALLNVSRPYVIELLEKGAIPYRMVGTRRRVRHADLLAYQRADDGRRKALLDELTREAETLKLGY